MRICKACKEPKPPGNYSTYLKKGRGRPYTDPTCRECKSKRHREKYAGAKVISNAIPHRLEEMRALQTGKHRAVFKLTGIPIPRDKYTPEQKEALDTWREAINYANSSWWGKIVVRKVCAQLKTIDNP